jgi:hypothetical protein
MSSISKVKGGARDRWETIQNLEARIGLLEAQMNSLLSNQAAGAEKAAKLMAAVKSGNPLAIIEAMGSL